MHIYIYMYIYGRPAPAETSITLVIRDENILKKVKYAEDISVRNVSFASDVFGSAPQVKRHRGVSVCVMRILGDDV